MCCHSVSVAVLPGGSSHDCVLRARLLFSLPSHCQKRQFREGYMEQYKVFSKTKVKGKQRKKLNFVKI